MTAKNKSRHVVVFLAILVTAFMGAFFLWPISHLIWRGLAGEEGRLVEVSKDLRFIKIIGFTGLQALLSTLLTLILAAPLTWAVANRRFFGRSFALAAVMVPFVLPTTVVASAFMAVIDQFGLDNERFSLRHSLIAVLAAHVFFNISVVVRTVGVFWSQLDVTQEQAAASLGASPIKVWFEITQRRLAGAVAGSAVIVFLFTFTSYAVILILGGPSMATLETEIARWAVTRGDIPTASALALIQIASVLAMVALSSRLGRNSAASGGLVPDRARLLSGWKQSLSVYGVVTASLGALAVPIFVLVYRSVRIMPAGAVASRRSGVATAADAGFGFDHYLSLAERSRLLPVSSLQALGNSLKAGFVAAGIATTIGLAASLVAAGKTRWRRGIGMAALLPLGTSSVTLGFGMLISLDRGILDLRTSWWITPIAQALVGIPFVMRAIAGPLSAIDPLWREAASTMGATPFRVWREIDLRLIRRAVLSGAMFALAVSLGEFGASSFVARRPDSMTVPLAIERLLSTPGTTLRGQAMALSVILMLLSGGLAMASEIIGGDYDRKHRRHQS